MREYSLQALVLEKEDLSEADARVVLYSPEYGKITAKIKSGRKILSKLNGHLEPCALVQARIVEKGDHIVDALLQERFNPSWPLVKFLHFVKEITFEGQADPQIWSLVCRAARTDTYDYHALLTIQGFDPRHALCQNCQRSRPEYFFCPDMNFWCRECLPADRPGKEIMLWSNGFIAVSS